MKKYGFFIFLIFFMSFFSSCATIDIEQPWDNISKLGTIVTNPSLSDMSAQKIDKPGNGFEMWFWHLEAEDGSFLDISIVFGKLAMFFKKDPTIVLFYKDRDVEISHTIKCDYDKWIIQPDYIDLNIMNNRFIGDNNTHSIVLDTDDIKGEININIKVPGMVLEDKKDYIKFGKKGYLFWVPAIMDGDFNGVIRIKNQEKIFSGSVYFDHMWTNLSAGELFAYHYWTILRGGHFNIVLGITTTSSKYDYTPLQYFGIYKDNKLIYAGNEFEIKQNLKEKTISIVTTGPLSLEIKSGIFFLDEIKYFEVFRPFFYSWDNKPYYYFTKGTCVLKEKGRRNLSFQVNGYHHVYPFFYMMDGFEFYNPE